MRNHRLWRPLVVLFLLAITAGLSSSCKYVQQKTKLPKITSWMQDFLRQQPQIETSDYADDYVGKKTEISQVNGCTVELSRKVRIQRDHRAPEGHIAYVDLHDIASQCIVNLNDIEPSTIKIEEKQHPDDSSMSMLAVPKGYPYWTLSMTTTGKKKVMKCQEGTVDSRESEEPSDPDNGKLKVISRENPSAFDDSSAEMYFQDEASAAKVENALKDATQICGGKDDLY